MITLLRSLFSFLVSKRKGMFFEHLRMDQNFLSLLSDTPNLGLGAFTNELMISMSCVKYMKTSQMCNVEE